MNILLTGSTGYIGRLLGQRLLERSGLRLRLLVRDKGRIPDIFLNRTEIVEESRQLMGFNCQSHRMSHGIGRGTFFFELHSLR